MIKKNLTKKIIEQVGGPSAIARARNISRQAVDHWFDRGIGFDHFEWFQEQGISLEQLLKARGCRPIRTSGATALHSGF